MFRTILSAAAALLFLPPALAGQTSAASVGDAIMDHFDASTRKVAMLAEAMPAESYTWSPGDGVMTVGHVYRHIARYNFMYLRDNLGVPAPADVDVDNLEELEGKEVTVEMLQRSIQHVREAVDAMPAEQLAADTQLYGSNVAGWAVLLQLVAHMNEHLGQSIAYARSNGVVPPWSG